MPPGYRRKLNLLKRIQSDAIAVWDRLNITKLEPTYLNVILTCVFLHKFCYRNLLLLQKLIAVCLLNIGKLNWFQTDPMSFHLYMEPPN